MKFYLPIPDAKLSPNYTVASIGGRYLKRQAAKLARDLARREAERVMQDEKTLPPRWLKAKMTVTLFHPTARTPDPANFMASLKAYEDGLADAGVVANDRGLWPERPEFRLDKRMPRIEIEITEDK